MAITPNTTVYLCEVPFDSTNKHQIYTDTKENQTTYFKTKATRTITEYTYVRKDNMIRAGVKFDDIVTCNYVMYQNTNHGTKWFYAFIEKMEYVNDNVTNIYIKTDVYQTWIHDVYLRASYVVREHSVTDGVGDNVIPESFDIKDYERTDITSYFDDTSFSSWGYLVTTTEQKGADGSRGCEHSGIYQGLYFYYFTNTLVMNEFLDAIEKEGGDCVISITCIPQFCVKGVSVGDGGWIYHSAEPSKLTKTHEKPVFSTIDGYKPKNNKCFTGQFYSMLVSNNFGETNQFYFEDWASNTIGFNFYADISVNPTMLCVPYNYKNLSEDYEECISSGCFPQCAFNSDTFKLWLSKNQFSVGMNVGNSIIGLIGGVAGGKLEKAYNSSMGIASAMNEVYKHSKDANKGHLGNSKGNLLTALKRNRFSFYIQYPKKKYIEMIDNYFTMYGYQTNRLKTPNIAVRKAFTYTQTIDCNITGSIPTEDMKELKSIFDNGVTLWRTTATFGNYLQDNGVMTP